MLKIFKIGLFALLSAIFIAFASSHVFAIDADIYEPDNNFTAANAIPTNGSLQHHSFHAGGDEDWIKLNVTNQSFYTIKTTNLLNNADTFVFLYDSDGTTLINSDDDGGVGLASKILYQADANETNYAKIRHFSSSGTGNYSISVTLEGSLIPSLVSPAAELIVPKNKSFDFVSSVRCVNGSCGNVTAALHLSNENNNLFSLSIDLEEYAGNYAYTADSSRENYDYKIRSALSDAKNINDEQIGVDVENLELEDIDMHNNDVYVKYSQKYESLPVYGGIVKLLVRDNKIIGANNRFFEGIDIETEPAVSKEEAESIASEDNLEIFDSELVVYPKNGQFFLAWKADVFDSKDPSVALRMFVDANSGEIINIEDMIIHDTASGNVTGMIIPEHPAQQRVKKPFSSQFIPFFDSAKNNVLNLTTNKSGKYSTDQLTGNITINAFLQGPFVKVLNEDKPEANHSFNATVPFVHDWNWNESDTSDGQEESNMFYHVNVVHDYFTKGAPFNISAMNYQIVATVEVNNNYCNAFYSPVSKNIFFGNSSACGNLALMSDVIYHEYTHSVVDHVYTEGLLEDNEGGAMHEGYADYFATTINNNSCLSEGFAGETCLRNVNNSLKYEDLKDEEIHDFGMVFGGSLWDLRENLNQDSADSLAIRAMKLEPVTMPEFLDSLLIVDDDNANLADGTPHNDAICEAFSTKHHISSANCGDGGVIPENSGGFFYTVNPNPVNDACLSNMMKNDVCPTTWTVNVTNAPKGRWKFFAVYSNDIKSAKTGNATILIEGPPDLNPISVNEIAQEDALFSFNASAISGSNPPHTFSTSNNTKYTVTKISDTKAKISFTPVNNDVPSVTLTVFVTDSQGLTDSEQVTIQVNNTNDAPIIASAHTPYSNPKIHSSKNITFNVTASDPDEKHGDALTVKWYVNGTLNTSGNKLIFNPDGKIGLYKVLANVTDKENASAFKEWLLTVAEKPIAETFVQNETTDFSKIPDLSNAADVKIGKAEGKISFNENLDLRFVVDLDNLINISKGFISIDTSQLPELNKSAILAMKSLEFSQKPLVHVDDGSGFVLCPSEICTNASYINNTLSFKVAHFSAYMAVENTTISIPSSKLNIKKVKAIIDGKSETVQEGEKIDDAKPGSEVKLKIKVENLFSNGDELDIEDISVEMSVGDMDDGEDIEEEADEFDLGADDEEEIELKFAVPFDVEEDTYDVLITAEGEDENKTIHKSEFNFELEVEKESHEVKISRLELSPSKVSCSKNAELKVEAVNSGSKDEDSAVVLAYSPELSLDFKEEGIELDENEVFSKSITIPISNDVLPGIYPINAKAYYGLNKISDEKTISLEIEDCIREETKEIAALVKTASEKQPVEVLYAASKKEEQKQTALNAKSDADDEFYVTLLLISHIVLIGLIVFLAGVLIIAKKR